MSPLKISQPDLVDGKDGLELRGVLWKDPQPETSRFTIKWDAAGENLSLEIDTSALASELSAMVQSALKDIITTSFTAKDPSKSGRLVLSWIIRSQDVATVSKIVSEIFGAEWEKATVQLLTAGPRNDEPQSATLWYGVPREQIPWFPMIDAEKCDGCGKCVEFCPNNVLRMSGNPSQAEVSNPFNCLVGCNSCASKCPQGAIGFPPREILQTIRSSFSR